MRIYHHPAQARVKEIRPRKILNRIKVYNDSMTLGKKSFIRFSFPKLHLQLLIENNPILMGKCSISKWAYKFDHDQLLCGLSHVSSLV
uniref:Uncharacterized protein n=1 Tax=Aegilops tauschii subsp. strangulata TaxID=200361 RepID=A0A453EGQ2_AEGTS